MIEKNPLFGLEIGLMPQNKNIQEKMCEQIDYLNRAIAANPIKHH
jgi:hypothetical protein